LKELEGDFIV